MSSIFFFCHVIALGREPVVVVIGGVCGGCGRFRMVVEWPRRIVVAKPSS
jgi:hypothetical protein